MAPEAKPLIQYFRGGWPDEVVPADEPTWLLYEVDTIADVVLREVEIFSDGSVTRNSIEIEAARGMVMPSLIDASFMSLIEENVVKAMNKDEFEAFWKNGVDRPFWTATA